MFFVRQINGENAAILQCGIWPKTDVFLISCWLVQPFYNSSALITPELYVM